MTVTTHALWAYYLPGSKKPQLLACLVCKKEAVDLLLTPAGIVCAPCRKKK